LARAVAASPDPEGTAGRLERWAEAAGPSCPPRDVLAALPPLRLERLALIMGHSPALGDWLVRFPDWAADLDDATLALEPTTEALTAALAEAAANPPAAADETAAPSSVPSVPFVLSVPSPAAPADRRLFALRRARRELLRIVARRLTGLADEVAMTADLSRLAVACIRLALAETERALAARFGQPRSEANADRAVGLAVIALGKLGGGELNVASDVDLIFVYGDEGRTIGRPDGSGRVANHLYFSRLVEGVIAFLAEIGPEGQIARVDARLRPDGETGPLARSLASCEAYYANQAHPWERLAMLKARAVAGDAAVGARFEAMISPLVFNPLHADRLLGHVRDMKRRIDRQADLGPGADRDVKRGPGGIREIEFLVQTLQMLHGARLPKLAAAAGTLPAMEALVRAGLLAEAQAARMREDYLFLRTVEHRLQLEELRQSHRLPDSSRALDLLARRCGLGSGRELMDRWREVAGRVHADWAEFFGADAPESDARSQPGGADADPIARAAAAVLSDMPEGEVLPALAPLGLAEVAAFKDLRRLAGLGSSLHLGETGRDAFARLAPALLRGLAASARPVAALAALEAFLDITGAHAIYYDFFQSTPATLDLLLAAFGASDDLAQALQAHPEDLDAMADAGLLAGPPDPVARRARLARRLASAGAIPEARVGALARFRRFENFMTALGEVAGLLDYPTAGARMTDAAEAALAAALEMAAAGLGLPTSPAGFAVLAMGKLGGGEMNEFSDLDLIFAWDDGMAAVAGRAPGEVAAALAEGVVALLASSSPEGRPYAIDARLRPEGQNAPLAPTAGRYLEYFDDRAQCWEMQSLMQLRPVAGDLALGERLRAGLAQVVARRVGQMDLAQEIRAMRRRVEQSLKLPSWIFCDFKKGAGGSMDLEFAVQFKQLSHLADDPGLMGLGPAAAVERLADAGRLARAEADRFLSQYRWLRQVERRARRLLGGERTVLPTSGEKLVALEKTCAPLLTGHGRRPLLDSMSHALRANRALYRQWVA
jgi:glutamate-ammonia-ligase adenylyltransferase